MSSYLAEEDLVRMLRRMVEANGGNAAATERHLGLGKNRIRQILVDGQPVSQAIAFALGYRRTVPGVRSLHHRPMKFVPLEPK